MEAIAIEYSISIDLSQLVASDRPTYHNIGKSIQRPISWSWSKYAFLLSSSTICWLVHTHTHTDILFSAECMREAYSISLISCTEMLLLYTSTCKQLVVSYTLFNLISLHTYMWACMKNQSQKRWTNETIGVSGTTAKKSDAAVNMGCRYSRVCRIPSVLHWYHTVAEAEIYQTAVSTLYYIICMYCARARAGVMNAFIVRWCKLCVSKCYTHSFQVCSRVNTLHIYSKFKFKWMPIFHMKELSSCWWIDQETSEKATWVGHHWCWGAVCWCGRTLPQSGWVKTICTCMIVV